MLAVLPKKDLDHFLPGEDGRWWDAGCSGWARCSATRPTRHPEAREPDWRMMDWKFLIFEFVFWNPIVHVGQLVVTAHDTVKLGSVWIRTDQNTLEKEPPAHLLKCEVLLVKNSVHLHHHLAHLNPYLRFKPFSVVLLGPRLDQFIFVLDPCPLWSPSVAWNMNGNIKQANYFHLFLNLLQSVSLLPAFALEQLLSKDACSQSDRNIVVSK